MRRSHPGGGGETTTTTAPIRRHQLSVAGFHAFQGLNYIISTAYVAYAAIARANARPAIIGAIANELVFDSYDAMCIALWVYAYACVHCIGWYYVCTTNDVYSKYASTSQLTMASMFGARLMMKMPNKAMGALMFSVDGVGALVKFYLVHVSRLGVVDIPLEKRVKYRKIPKPPGASTYLVLYERLALVNSVVYICVAFVVLEFSHRFAFFRAYKNPNTTGLLAAALFVTGLVSHSWIPTLRQGQWGTLFVLIASQTFLAFVLEAYDALPAWFVFAINLPFFTGMTVAITNAFFVHALDAPLFTGPTFVRFHRFTVSMESISFVFVLISLVYSDLWHRCIIRAVTMPRWGRVQFQIVDYLNFPILRVITKRLPALSLPTLRFSVEKTNVLIKGSAELANTSFVVYSTVLHIIMGLSIALLRTTSSNAVKSRRATRLLFGSILVAVSYLLCDHFLVSIDTANPWTARLEKTPTEYVWVASFIWTTVALGTIIFLRYIEQLSYTQVYRKFEKVREPWRNILLKHSALERYSHTCMWLNGALPMLMIALLILRLSGLPHPFPMSRGYLIPPKYVMGIPPVCNRLFLLASQNLILPSFSDGVMVTKNTLMHTTFTVWFTIFALYYRVLTGEMDIISRTVIHTLHGCSSNGCDAKRYGKEFQETVAADLQIMLIFVLQLRRYIYHMTQTKLNRPSAQAAPRIHARHRATMMMCTLGALTCAWHALIKISRILGNGTPFTSFDTVKRLHSISAAESVNTATEDFRNIEIFGILALIFSRLSMTNGKTSFGRRLKFVIKACSVLYTTLMVTTVSRFVWLCGYMEGPLPNQTFISLAIWSVVAMSVFRAALLSIDSTKRQIHYNPAIKVTVNTFKKVIQKSSRSLAKGRRQGSFKKSTVLDSSVSLASKWKNRWIECYKEEFGDEVFEKASNSEFPIPMPPPDARSLVLLQLKTALMFVFGTLMNKRRPTHPVGVGAIGQFTVFENKKVPKNVFFTKGKNMPVILRHSNAVGVKSPVTKDFDDATLEIRGCALKFSNAEDESPFDLHLNTGEFAGFFNLESFLPFVFQMATFNDSAYKAWGRKYPTGIMAGISGVRRAPDSYCDLHYYSQTCREFHALDGKKRYCKFRLIPYGNGPGTDVDPEPNLPNEADQRLIATTHMMKYYRYADEKRAPDYLRAEFRDKVESGIVRYRLQIQLYEATPTDTAEIFNPNKAWGTEFLDVGIVKLHASLPQHVIENTAFGMSRTPACMPLSRPINAQDYNGLNWTRAAVYETSSKIRRLFTRRRNNDYDLAATAKYTIKVKTYSIAGSGINADVCIQFVGTRSTTSRIVLEDLGTSFAPGAETTHIVRDMDIGEPTYAIISHSANSSWNCGRIDVSLNPKNGRKKKFTLNVWRYINPSVRFVAPCSVQSRTSALCRELITDAIEQNLSFMKEEFDWSNGSYLPNHSTYSDHSELPMTEQFSKTKYKDFFVDTFVGFENKGIADMIKDEHIKTLDDYYQLYASLPPVAITRDWRTDEEFGRQFMNGTHPNQIRKIASIPAKFHVSEADVRGVLPRGKTLASELAAGHIFMVDYEILDGIKRGDGYCVENSMALFFADDATSLRPICIQHFQSGDTPIWTPKDGEYEWLLAKAHLVCSDGNVHQMISHLLGTHLLMEPWSVCVERNLPRSHPVYRVLRPHLIYVIAINTLGRSLLIAPGGVTDRVVAVGQGGHMDLMSKAYQRFKLDDLNVPKSFESRGVLETDALRGYHHRDDALQAWVCLRQFAASVFGANYSSNDEVRNDPYIQNMILEMRRHGYQGVDEEQHGVPSSIDSIEQLVDICTSIMYTCSFTHAGVNFSQWDYYSFVPNRPLIMRKPASRRKEPVTEEDVIDALPSVKQGAQTMATGWTLSQFSKEEVYIGHYLTDMMITPREIAALSQLRHDLSVMGQRIEKRNAALGIKAYSYLHPKHVPSNIGV
jgi:arachidonate 5-lipoxygenase